MKFITGSYSSLTNTTRNALFAYRYQVFIEHLGWELETPEGIEIDQFDHAETVYIIAKSEAQDIIGCARLLPTDSPYLLEEVFPELLNGQPPPKDPRIWELSRFTAFDLKSNEVAISGQFSSDATVELLRQTLMNARSLGAQSIISVSPIGVERLLRRAGFKAHRAGPPKIIDGYPLVACRINLLENL